jgi:prepilin-type processing-associated H-X9-DG protein
MSCWFQSKAPFLHSQQHAYILPVLYLDGHVKTIPAGRPVDSFAYDNFGLPLNP